MQYQKTITNEERIEAMMNIKANNKLRGSKYIKPSYSALGNMIRGNKYAARIINPETYRYN
jgi:hypothetical protein